jgi:hypothetical protein
MDITKTPVHQVRESIHVEKDGAPRSSTFGDRSRGVLSCTDASFLEKREAETPALRGLGTWSKSSVWRDALVRARRLFWVPPSPVHHPVIDQVDASLVLQSNDSTGSRSTPAAPPPSAALTLSSHPIPSCTGSAARTIHRRRQARRQCRRRCRRLRSVGDAVVSGRVERARATLRSGT